MIHSGFISQRMKQKDALNWLKHRKHCLRRLYTEKWKVVEKPGGMYAENVMGTSVTVTIIADIAEGSVCGMDFPIKCKCGANARIRTTGEYAWVECSSKKCDMRSGYVHFVNDKKYNVMEYAVNHAVDLWNRMVEKDG